MNISQWETQSVNNIDALLRVARIKYAEFNQIQRSGSTNHIVDREWLRFRSIVMDLYSVLDYVCYLLHCHYKNDGEPTYSSESRNVKFPYKSKLKFSSASGQETSAKRNREDWKKTNSDIIFGALLELEDQPGDTAEVLAANHKRRTLYNQAKDHFGEMILNLQIKTEVDAGGKEIGLENVEMGSADKESFNLLHFFRNYSAHRDLIQFYESDGVLYVNLDNPSERSFVPEGVAAPEYENSQTIHIGRGFWINCPDLNTLPTGSSDQPQLKPQPLLILIDRLISFVRMTRNNLLKALDMPSHENNVTWADNGLKVGEVFTPWDQYENILYRDVY